MKVEVKKVDAVVRELRFEVPKDRVAKTFEEVYEELGKRVKVKGFREGKVPRNVIEAQHGKAAKEEVIRSLIPRVYQEALVKESLSPVDHPEINDVAIKDGVLTFAARLEIKPDIKIKDYTGLKVTRKSSQVTDEEMNKTLEMFKKSYEEGQKEKKDIAVDDTFARGLGFPNLEEFKKSLARQMEMEKDRQNRWDVENQIITALLEKTKFAVPSSVVNRQLENRLNDVQRRLKSQGMNDADIKKKQDEILAALKEEVEKDVKVYFLLDKIAELEKIEVKEGENLPAKVMEFLLKEAQWT